MSDLLSPTRVAVKFHRKIILPYERGAERALEGSERQRWYDVASKVGPIALDPLFGDRRAVVLLLDRARGAKAGHEPPHLLGWFTIGCDGDVAQDLVRALRQWSAAVDEVYVMASSAPPQLVTFEANPDERRQGFHLVAPGGIDARYAWGIYGGDSGARLAVVDNAFDLGFDDLRDPIGFPLGLGDIVLTWGQNAPPGPNVEPVHGAAALAVAVARDNTSGGVGIAPRAPAVACSTFNTRNPPFFSTAEAIVAGAAMNFTVPGFGANAGDVVLLEVGFTGVVDDANPQDVNAPPALPAEVEPAAFDAIRAATDAGIIVVEPAGNSDVDLDRVRRNGKAILDRSSPDFRDSGAIVVSAAFSGFTPGTTPRARIVLNEMIPNTSRRKAVATGNRIDCFAWGDGVQTGLPPGSGGETIGNTSAAAAIVAGAVIVVQGIAKDRLGGPRSPADIRTLFSDPTLNTPSADPPVDRIGVMPNLRSIIRGGLGIVPDVDLVLRDFLDDDGSPAGLVTLGRSPDIVVRNVPPADPQAELGDASTRPSVPISLTDPTYVYLRVGNIGRQAASNVWATVFWSPMDAVLDPSAWKLIGNAYFPPVPADASAVTVSRPLRWDSAHAEMPEPFWEFMLIAFVGGDRMDPMPWQWLTFDSEDALRAFVGASNNMATRKVELEAVSRWSWLVHTVLKRLWDLIPFVRR